MNTGPRIVVTKPIPEVGMALLRSRGEIVVGPNGPLDPDRLVALVRGAQVLVCFVTDPVDSAVLEAAAPSCSLVASYGVGTDNIDLAAATRLGIRVTNTPDVLTDATADLAFALILAVSRRLQDAARLARSGTWAGIEPLQIFGHDVSGKTLGIVGAGRIGTAVARRAVGFDMPIFYHARQAVSAMDALGASWTPLPDLLSRADFVSLHVPLTDETHHLISLDSFRLMKRSAVLINTSRGRVVREADLVQALVEGTIAGAGLDVYEAEPSIPSALCAAPNTVCLPHVGSATQETREKMALMTAKNVIAHLEGRPLLNPVN